jgi:maleamate amidohydrolase
LSDLRETKLRYLDQGWGDRIGFGDRPALLIVDMQHDSIDEDAPTTCAPMAQERLPTVVRLLEAAREARIPVIFTQGVVAADLSDVGLWKGPHGRGEVQIEGTPGVEIVSELQPRPEEPIVRKRRPSAFFGTGLEDLLGELDVDTLIVAGSSMSGCVRATVVDAFSRDLRTIVVDDCVIDRSPAALEASLIDVDAKYADAVSHHEVIEYLTRVRQPG